MVVGISLSSLAKLNMLGTAAMVRSVYFWVVNYMTHCSHPCMGVRGIADSIVTRCWATVGWIGVNYWTMGITGIMGSIVNRCWAPGGNYWTITSTGSIVTRCWAPVE